MSTRLAILTLAALTACDFTTAEPVEEDLDFAASIENAPEVPADTVRDDRGGFALSLSLAGPFVPGGAPGSVTVTGAGSGDFIRVLRGQPGISCPLVLGGDCLDLQNVTIQLTGAADATGSRTFSMAIPASVPTGVDLCMQAMAGMAAPFDFSNVDCAPIESAGGGACQGGAVEVSTAPGGDMMLCDDPTDLTCEEDFESLCPAEWHLCTMDDFNSRNDGWTQPADTFERALGVIYCRHATGAGHFTVPDSGSTIATLGEDEDFNCFYGSSRPDSCPVWYGCNEQEAHALCCAPQPLCGNGVVDHADEQCDDGNADDTDDCLSSCAWRNPRDHGFSGTNCL